MMADCFSGNAENLRKTAHDILKYSNDGRQRRKEQEQEEEASENPSALHRGENVRQRHKDQLRAAVRLYVVGEARRENDEACGNRYKRIERCNADCLAEQGFSAV